MCLKCLRETRPDRGRVTMEHGSYIVNFRGCAQCGNKTSISVINNEVENEFDDADDLIAETVTYNRKFIHHFSPISVLIRSH